MNELKQVPQWRELRVELQVSLQRDHYRKALERILAYAEPPEAKCEMTDEELTDAYNALKEIARNAVRTCPGLR